METVDMFDFYDGVFQGLKLLIVAGGSVFLIKKAIEFFQMLSK